MTEQLNHFLLGGLVVCCAVAGLFFLKFWRKTADRLFAIFAVAFWTLGLNWVLLGITPGNEEYRPALYLLRLVAFVLIIVGIVDKNRQRRG